MLKLTTQHGGAVYINPRHIVAIERCGRLTNVFTLNGTQQVQETPDQIMLMPAMQRFVYGGVTAAVPLAQRPEEDMAL